MLSPELMETISATYEACGTEISKGTLRLVYADLEGHNEHAVFRSLERCRREVKGRLTTADILERLDDGRPGVEEAWAMLPKDEQGSAAVTDEMREALACWDQVTAGDLIGARMPFKEIYTAACRRNRADKKPVAWSMSLGYAKSGRADAYADAIAKGRLTLAHAAAALDPECMPRMEKIALEYHGGTALEPA